MPDLPHLQTERLQLRPFQPADLDLLHRIWTDPDVRRYLWDDLIISRETAREVLDSHEKTVAGAGIGFWVVIHRDTGQPAGFCGFRFIDDSPEVELLYGLLPRFWSQGVATEASRAALDFLWQTTTLPHAWARTDPPNARSVTVMQRLGMTHHSTTDTMITYRIDRPRPDATS